MHQSNQVWRGLTTRRATFVCIRLFEWIGGLDFVAPEHAVTDEVNCNGSGLGKQILVNNKAYRIDLEGFVFVFGSSRAKARVGPAQP